MKQLKLTVDDIGKSFTNVVNNFRIPFVIENTQDVIDRK